MVEKNTLPLTLNSPFMEAEVTVCPKDYVGFNSKIQCVLTHATAALFFCSVNSRSPTFCRS